MSLSRGWLRSLTVALSVACVALATATASAADELPGVVIGEVESIDQGASGRIVKVAGARFVLPSGVPVDGVGGAVTTDAAVRPGVRVQLEVRREGKIAVVERVRLIAD